MRIKMKNFMTYDEVQLFPGPNLNMILGPNGTGKSTIVCCIIVGLAGEVHLTGRGSSPADFVKKNTDWCSTEIELFNDRNTSWIVERKIIITNRSSFKLEHKSEWKINKKSVLKSDVSKLTKKLNIKVDNLCQFLPQDSVTQFVKMNTCELLINTLKAAGDNQLVEDHAKLVEYSKEVEEKTKLLETLEKSCQENEVHAQRLEGQVHLLRQREQLVKEKNICGQKIHYVKYLQAKKDLENAIEKRDKMKDDLKDIDANTEPFKRDVELKKAEESRIKMKVDSLNKDICRLKNNIQSAQTEIEQLKVNWQEEFHSFKEKIDQEKQRESNLRLKQQELNSLECRLSETRDVDCSHQMKELEAEMNKIVSERKKLKAQMVVLEDRIRRQVHSMNELKNEIESINKIHEKKNNFLKVKMPEAYKVLEWLERNRQIFRKRIYLPIMCEINVKDRKYYSIVENAIPQQELAAFVCQTAEDLTLFTRLVREQLHLNFNVILTPDKTMEEFDAEAAQGPKLGHLGVKANLKELIDAPEPIMRVLCGSHNFHRIPVAENCTSTQLKQLLNSCQRFYVNDQFYTVTKSRYSNDSMTTSDKVRDARFVIYSLDQKRHNECEAQVKELQKERDKDKVARDEIHRQDEEHSRNWQQLNRTFNELRAKHEERSRLETLINRTRELIKKLSTQTLNLEAERTKLDRAIDKITKEMVLVVEKMSTKYYPDFAVAQKERMITMILQKSACDNHHNAQRRYLTAQKDTSRLREEISKLMKELNTLKTTFAEYEKLAEDKIPGFDEGKLNRSTQRKFDSMQEKTVQELLDKREDLNIRIQRAYNDSSNSIMNEYNRQNEELKSKRVRIEDLKTSLRSLDISVGEIKREWMPKLEEVITVIDGNYREFMQKLNYDGQVKLDFNPNKLDDFSAYGIMILVRYRDSEELRPLSSTRQSGGERSVATMIYMLALQAKTTVPFRCVDEINQGMDKENERKVFELLVKTADSSSSQYFLVSPKLLSDLPYSEKMKFHVVFNGPHLKLDWNEVIKAIEKV